MQFKRILHRGRNPLIRFWAFYFWKPKNHSLEAHLESLLAPLPAVYVLQVGANDGLVNDPLVMLLRKYPHWQACLLEPQPFVFREQLQKLYPNTPGIQLKPFAISNSEQSLPLYVLSFSQKRWATGLAGFLRANLQAAIDNGYVESKARKYGEQLPANKDQWITQMDVPCRRFDQLLDELNWPTLQLLQLDTEGYDFQLIRMFPFHRLKPYCISFESNNLSQQESEDCNAFLRERGYEILELDRDRIAWLRAG